MPIRDDLLKILCCPVSKQPVKMLESDKLKKLNDLIESKSIKDNEGKIVEQPIIEALVTVDDKTIYRIDDEIPVMLVDASIDAVQLS